MRRFTHLDNLQMHLTPKQRVSRLLWDALFLGVVCVVGWDGGVYVARFGESGEISQLIVPVLLAIVIAWLMRLAFRARKHWYWVIVLTLLAFAGPFILRAVQA
jgi:hypothetical protein